MRFPVFFICAVIFVNSMIYAADVAVFPVQGVNTDKSFVDAFGMLLAAKYGKHSGLDVLPPTKSARAIEEDSSLSTAAHRLGVKEYLETEAIGLYISRREKAEVEYASDSGKQTIIVKVEKEDDDDDDDSDQKLLDKHKTVVTVTRRNSSGDKIHSAEMTLLTYGDIEESTDRMAEALHKKLSIDEVLGLYNVTRREGMGRNKVFVDNLKGVKVGFIYPADRDYTLVNIVTIGYNHRMDSEKFFLEFGVGGKLPTNMDTEKYRLYGGVYLHVGGSYYIVKEIAGVHVGLGLSPHINIGAIGSGVQVGLVPFFQFGISVPRNSKVQALINLKIGQNVLAIKTGRDSTSIYSPDYPPEAEHYPTEIGFEMGIGF